ncbi:hypothetical protein H0W91_04095 [Patescibacteria group bacterium]|nr:hypothetical protein [Patescibacteria group bacterium]
MKNTSFKYFTDLTTNTGKFLAHYTWWELTIFVIGVLSFISIIVVLFLPLGNGPSKFTYAGEVPSTNSSTFLNSISTNLTLPVRSGQPIEILPTGEIFLSRLLADIDSAKTSINIMVYIFQNGKMSDQVFDHLDKKAKEGVEVRIMYDDFGSKPHIPRKRINELKKLGGKVHAFHSLTIAPWEFLRNHKRNHRRAFIIDGEIGYTGGMAISDDWLATVKPDSAYHDVMFRTTGNMVRDIQGTFSELWTGMTAEILVGDKFFKDLSVDKAGSLSYVALTSTPSSDSLTLQKFYLLSILSAEHSIYLTTPYFLPDKSLSEALIKKVKEGVNVRILVPNILNDSTSLYYASHYSYQPLLEAGVKIYEYQPHFNHSKSLVVDNLWSVVGSANMDYRSRKINEESIFGVYDKTFATGLQNIFTEDLKNAKEIDLAEWKKRPIWHRMREIFDQKFVQQY